MFDCQLEIWKEQMVEELSKKPFDELGCRVAVSVWGNRMIVARQNPTKTEYFYAEIIEERN